MPTLLFGTLGGPEIAIIAGVIVLMFGVGKISGLGREFGNSIKEFRRAVKEPIDADSDDSAVEDQPQTAESVQQTQEPPQSTSTDTTETKKNVF
jgi:sec-independent protein translocase protein TatA